MGLEDLYQQQLLDHARSKANRGNLADPAKTLSLHNPLCGDEVTLSLRSEDGVVREAKFSGSGCMISQAAASMLIQEIVGKSVPEARTVISAFRSLMRGEEATIALGDLQALEGVKKFPIRIKCALLVADVAERLLKDS